MHENEEVVLMRFKDIWGKIEIPTNQDDFPHQGFSPKVIKAFGVMSIICALASLCLIGVFAAHAVGDINHHERPESMLLAIGIVLLAITAIVLFVAMGVRFTKNNTLNGERFAITTIALILGAFLAMMMPYGLSLFHIVYVVELVFLAVVTVYMDPELAEERYLSKEARTMDPQKRAQFEKKVDSRKPLKGYITLNFFNLFWIFVVCSILGLAIETVFHLAIYHAYQDRAGLLYGPFSPIYGFGGLFMTVALNRFHDKPIPVIFLISALIGGCVRVHGQLDHAKCIRNCGLGLFGNVPFYRWPHELHVHVLLGHTRCDVGEVLVADLALDDQQDSVEAALCAYRCVLRIHGGGCGAHRADDRLLVLARSGARAEHPARRVLQQALRQRLHGASLPNHVDGSFAIQPRLKR